MSYQTSFVELKHATVKFETPHKIYDVAESIESPYHKAMDALISDDECGD